MKKIIYLSLFTFILSSTGIIFANYDAELNKNPIFMEKVFSFILTKDITTVDTLTPCEIIYLEANRRREYTEGEIKTCGDYIIKKNEEEIAYMKYMLNNREKLDY